MKTTQCKVCGNPSHIDPANGEDYGHCLPCILGAFAQVKDAQLVAAAPDMLQTLRHALSWCEADFNDGDGHPTESMLEARVETLRGAIYEVNEGATV